MLLQYHKYKGKVKSKYNPNVKKDWFNYIKHVSIPFTRSDLSQIAYLLNRTPKLETIHSSAAGRKRRKMHS